MSYVIGIGSYLNGIGYYYRGRMFLNRYNILKRNCDLMISSHKEKKENNYNKKDEIYLIYWIDDIHLSSLCHEAGIETDIMFATVECPSNRQSRYVHRSRKYYSIISKKIERKAEK